MVGFMIAWLRLRLGARCRDGSAAFSVDARLVNDAWAILLCLNVIMLIAGAFLDLTAIMLIVVPISLPTGAAIGCRPCTFRYRGRGQSDAGWPDTTLWTAGLHPFRHHRHVGSGDLPAVLPFLAVLIFGLGLITYIPGISLAFVRAFF